MTQVEPVPGPQDIEHEICVGGGSGIVRRLSVGRGWSGWSEGEDGMSAEQAGSESDEEYLTPDEERGAEDEEEDATRSGSP